MKKALLVCLLMVAMSTQAQDNNSEFKKETIEFIKLTGAGSAFESAIAQIGTKTVARAWIIFKESVSFTNGISNTPNSS